MYDQEPEDTHGECELEIDRLKEELALAIRMPITALIAIVVARCQEEVEAVTMIPPEGGSLWGRCVIKASGDVKKAQEAFGVLSKQDGEAA